MLQLLRDKSKGWTPPAPTAVEKAAAAFAAAPAPSSAAAVLAASGVSLTPPKPAAKRRPLSAAEEAVLRSGVQTAADVSDMLWVDAHRPLSTEHIIGNPGLVKQIHDWLKNWHTKRKERESGAISSKIAAKMPKAMLISGPPGIGQ
jgi:hypothetical protein